MENCYKKVEGFLDSCGKFFASEEDAWVSDAAKEVQKYHNDYVRNCNLGRLSSYDKYSSSQYKDMDFDQAQRVVRKALELTQSKNCCNGL